MNALDLLLLTDEEKDDGVWLGEERNSEHKSWWSKDRIYYHSQWKNGKLHGICKVWGPDGTLFSQEEYAKDWVVRDFF